MSNLVRFRRHRRRRPGFRRPLARLRHAPGPPLAALVGVAALLWFAAELHPGVMKGAGAVAVDGNGAFTLCARASEQNCVTTATPSGTAG